MKMFSLKRISKSAIAKVAGLAILAILAIGFFAFPLAAFADDCGKQQITVTTYIDGTQLINYATQLIKGNAKAPTFQSYKSGTTLSNGSIVVGTHQPKKGAALQPALAVVVNGKAVGIGNNQKGIAMATGTPQLLNAKTVAPVTTAATKK